MLIIRLNLTPFKYEYYYQKFNEFIMHVNRLWFTLSIFFMFSL